MNPETAPTHGRHPWGARYTAALRGAVYALIVVAGLGTFAMMTVTCLDVVLRIFRLSFTGAYDIVKIASAITLAASLPYTAAVKGHVAIEYFFHKLGRRGRRVADAFTQLAGMALFGFLAWECVAYGNARYQSGQVTQTLQWPDFWVLYVMAFACAIVVLVLAHHLRHPGQVLIKP